MMVESPLPSLRVMVTVSPTATSPPTLPVTVTLPSLSAMLSTLSAVTLLTVIDAVGGLVSTR